MANLQARDQRRIPTQPKLLLWSRPRDRRLAGFKFCRQHPIGPFIADFASVEHHLIVEADGGQHVDCEYDAYRSAWLQDHGGRVLRFWNNEILANPNGVAEAIHQELGASGGSISTCRTLHPHPPR